MSEKIDRLEGIFIQMSENYDDFGGQWKNIPLAKEAFSLLKELPEIRPDAAVRPG